VLVFKNQGKLLQQEKSYSGGRFVKKRMLNSVASICPRITRNFQSIRLSRTTVQRKVEDIAVNSTER